MVTPIDLMEGKRYIKLVNSEGQGYYLDHIYKITSIRDGYVNPMDDEKPSWHNISSCTLNFGESLRAFKINYGGRIANLFSLKALQF